MENNLFTDTLQKKILWAQKRMHSAQRDLWMYRTMLEVTAEKTNMRNSAKKVVQLDFLAG